jgi:hypothetical protein
MNFLQFFNETLSSVGFSNAHAPYAVKRPYSEETGWPLELSKIEFGEKTLGHVHFPDFITLRSDGSCVELEQIEKFYGNHAHQILVTHWTHDLDQFYTGPVNLIRFSSHNLDTIVELRDRFDEWKHILDQPRPTAWQCLNGRICTHRRLTANILKDFDNGWLSLGMEMPLPEHAYDRYPGCENDDNFIALKYIYGSTAVNIVTETQFFEPTGIVTEKTLHAIMAEQIPIVIGHKGIVEHCRQMGLDMFDDLVDTSYDAVDGVARISAAIESNRDLITGRIDLSPYKDRLRRNREYVLWGLVDKMQADFAADARALGKKLLPAYMLLWI